MVGAKGEELNVWIPEQNVKSCSARRRTFDCCNKTYFTKIGAPFTWFICPSHFTPLTNFIVKVCQGYKWFDFLSFSYLKWAMKNKAQWMWNLTEGAFMCRKTHTWGNVALFHEKEETVYWQCTILLIWVGLLPGGLFSAQTEPVLLLINLMSWAWLQWQVSYLKAALCFHYVLSQHF